MSLGFENYFRNRYNKRIQIFKKLERRTSTKSVKLGEFDRQFLNNLFLVKCLIIIVLYNIIYIIIAISREGMNGKT